MLNWSFTSIAVCIVEYVQISDLFHAGVPDRLLLFAKSNCLAPLIFGNEFQCAFTHEIFRLSGSMNVFSLDALHLGM